MASASLQQLNSFYHHSGNGILQGDRYGNILNLDQQQQQNHQNFREIDFTEKSLVPPFPFPEKPVNIASYIQPSVLNGGASTAIDSSWSTTQSALRRPSSFIAADNTSSTYGSCIYTNHNPSLYGYALIQKPYLVPVGTLGTSSVYMSCYTATNYGSYINISCFMLIMEMIYSN